MGFLSRLRYALQPKPARRPLFNIEGDYSGFEPSAKWIQNWLHSETANREIAVFSSYPAHSLLSWNSRAFLYHLVRSMKPDVIVEIGTYYAGTAEILTRALTENRNGHLYTTDPYGAERCPGIIRGWPKEIRKRVSFLPKNSMGLAETLRSQNIKPDIVFIDGCHDFEYVLFDALAMSKIMSRNGIMVLDNFDHPGVICASLEFLQLNPDWSELGSAATAFDSRKPFNSSSSKSDVTDTDFIVLAAPDFESAGASAFYATGQIAFESEIVDAVQLQKLRGPAKGVLFSEVWLRGFGNGMPLECSATSKTSIEVNEAVSDFKIVLDRQLDLNEIPRKINVRSRTCEISLFWVPEDNTSTLKFGSVSGSRR